MRVTVIPSDRVIIVDGRTLRFDFEAPPNVHALQWVGNGGEIEFVDGQPNRPLTDEDVAILEPFVVAFHVEAARLDSCPGPYHDWDPVARKWAPNDLARRAAHRLEIESQITAVEAQGARAGREIKLAELDGQTPPAEAVARLRRVDAEIGQLRARLAALSADPTAGE